MASSNSNPSDTNTSSTGADRLCGARVNTARTRAQTCGLPATIYNPRSMTWTCRDHATPVNGAHMEKRRAL